MLAKSLLSTLMACHAIHLVIHPLPACICPINKELPVHKPSLNNKLCSDHMIHTWLVVCCLYLQCPVDVTSSWYSQCNHDLESLLTKLLCSLPAKLHAPHHIPPPLQLLQCTSICQSKQSSLTAAASTGLSNTLTSDFAKERLSSLAANNTVGNV